MSNSIKKKVRELHRDTCFLRTAVIKSKDKDKKSELFKQKNELEKKESFYKNFIKQMEKENKNENN